MTVGYTPSFIRAYKHLPSSLQHEIKEKIVLFMEDPKHASLRVHKLKGRLQDRWSFSVNYKYRIVFQFVSPDEVIFLTVGDHDVYKE